MKNLKTLIVRSGAWVFCMRFVHQVFYLGRLRILARLLAPKDFGIMGFVSPSPMFGQKKDLIRLYLY